MPSLIDNNIIAVLVTIIGLIIGSFISLVSYRLPHDLDIIYKRSNCPKCNHVLTVKDLIPLFSWLVNLGKCRHCFSKISYRYPAIEILSAFITLYIYKNFGFSILALLYLIAAFCLFVMIITDFEHYIIPDSIQIILAVIGLALNFFTEITIWDQLIASFTGILTGFALKYGFLYAKKKDSLGMGDIKFLGVAGLYLGLNPLPIFFFIAGIIGIITALIWRALNKGAIFPFGPALAISMITCILIPQIEQSFTSSIINLTSLFIK